MSVRFLFSGASTTVVFEVLLGAERRRLCMVKSSTCAVLFVLASYYS